MPVIAGSVCMNDVVIQTATCSEIGLASSLTCTQEGKGSCFALF